MSIFDKRINIKPYEYPELLQFKDAIRHSYWLHTEFESGVNSDVQDYKANLTEKERTVITRTMLAISQIEVNVKRFWGNLYNIFPKPEIDDVGGTNAESEVRHKDAYSFILERLGLNNLFEHITEIPAIQGRIKYLEEFMAGNTGLEQRQENTLILIMFSMFVEHISLFGQFLIMSSFNKERNLLKGISNIVEATSKEEELHGQFGFAIYKIIKNEHPELFTKEFYFKLKVLADKALKAEIKIIDWIYEDGDIKGVEKDMIINYIKNRFNQSLEQLGLVGDYEVDEKLLERTLWFDIEITGTKLNDFFSKRSVDYSKKNNSITGDDLF